MANVTRKHRSVARRGHLLAALLRSRSSKQLELAIPYEGDTRRLRRRARDDRAVRSAPAVQVRRRARPADALVPHQPRVDQKGHLDGRPLRPQQPVGRAVDGEAHDLLRDDAARDADPRDVDDPAEVVRADARPRSRRSSSYAKLFDLGAIGKKIGYPMFMKPYDGGGWRGVTPDRRRGGAAQGATTRAASGHAPAGGGRIRSIASCAASASGRRRTSCTYDPDAPLHDRYTQDDRASSPTTKRSSCATPRSRSTRSSAGTSTRARRCARTASGTRSTSPTRARTRRSRRCTATSRGW